MEAKRTTLTDQLRLAALARAEQGGRIVDTYVIDDDGVIDLRSLVDRQPVSRASEPVPLGEMAGLFGDAADVGELYSEETEPSRQTWRRRAADRLPARPRHSDHDTEPGNESQPSPEAIIDLTDGHDPCPRCGAEASLDLKNPLLGLDFYSCRDCLLMWHVERQG